MTTFSVTLNIGGTSSIENPTTVTQNITSSDTISATINTPTTAFVDWFVLDIFGCNVSSFGGVPGQVITVTPIAGNTSYYVTFITERTTAQDVLVQRYGKIQGTISSGGGTDTTPDQFTFTDQSNVALSTTVISNSITVAGIDNVASISITGGTYSIDGGAYTSSSGSVTNGQTVSVQHTSSGTNSAATNTTLTIGGVSDVFTSTTLAAVAPDTTPDQFTFTNVVGASLSTVYTSNGVQILNINTASPISVSGGTYNIDGGAFTSTAGTISNGQTARVQITSSPNGGTSTSTTLTVGGVSSTFTVTTAGSDTIPDAFSFTNQTGVPLSTLTSSNEVQIFGINFGAPVSITGGEYSIALDPTTYTVFTTNTGTIYNGQSIKVRHTSSASTNTNTSTTLNIGGVQATFTSTTTSVIPAVYGMRIYDESGNITLDTTDDTIKDLGVFAINSVTANQSILGVPVTTNSIALVNNNNGDTDTSVASALVSLNISTSSITVSGGFTGFNISIRVMEF